MQPNFEAGPSNKKQTERRTASSSVDQARSHRERAATAALDQKIKFEANKQSTVKERELAKANSKEEKRALKYLAETDIRELPPHLKQIKSQLFLEGVGAGITDREEKSERLSAGLQRLQENDPKTARKITQEILELAKSLEEKAETELDLRFEMPMLRNLAEMDTDTLPPQLKKARTDLLARSTQRDESILKRLAEGFKKIDDSNPKRAAEILKSLQEFDFEAIKSEEKKEEAEIRDFKTILVEIAPLLEGSGIPAAVKKARQDLLIRSSQHTNGAEFVARSSKRDKPFAEKLSIGFENLRKDNPKRAAEILRMFGDFHESIARPERRHAMEEENHTKERAGHEEREQEEANRQERRRAMEEERHDAERERENRPESKLLKKLVEVDLDELPKEIKNLRADLLFRNKERNTAEIYQLLNGFDTLSKKDKPLADKYLGMLEKFEEEQQEISRQERRRAMEEERHEQEREAHEKEREEEERYTALVRKEYREKMRLIDEEADAEKSYKKTEKSLETEIKRLSQLESALKMRVQKATQSSSAVRRWLSALTNGRFKTPEQIEIDGLNENLADVEKKMQEAMEDLQMHRYTHNRIPDRGTRLRTEPAAPKSMISMEDRRRNERNEAEEVRASRGERELPRSSHQLEKDYGITELQEFENSIKENPRLAVESLPNAAKLWDHLKDAMLKQKDDLNLDNSEIASAATEIVLRLAMYRKAMEMDDVDEAQKYQDQAQGIARAHGLRNDKEIAKVIDLEHTEEPPMSQKRSSVRDL